MVIIKFSMGRDISTTRGHGTSHAVADFRTVVKVEPVVGAVAVTERRDIDATGAPAWVAINLPDTDVIVRRALLEACRGGRGPVTVDDEHCFVSQPIREIDLGKIK
jgi:hypothetical protein